jgi:uncharacterized protein YrrD
MVGVKGLEPSTSRSQTAHSSQLSYTPMIFYFFFLIKKEKAKAFCRTKQKIARKSQGVHNEDMNISVKSIIGKPIKSNLGTISQALFSIEKGRFLGIKTDAGIFLSADQLIFEEDNIRIISENKKDESGENWMGFRVFSEDEEDDFGEITDIEFDPDLSIIRRILVTKSVFGLPFSRHIFPYERISNVEKKTVYVDTDTKDKDGEWCPAM